MIAALAVTALLAQGAPSAAIDHAAAPGANYDKAEFRFWVPAAVDRVQAVLVLVPGSNGDGRPMADEPFWQDFAARQRLAIVAWVGHAVARSRDLGAMAFADVLKLRAGGPSLTSIDPKSGFIADLKARTFQPAAEAPARTERTAWLPTLAIAKAWQAVVTGKPFEP